MEQKQYFLEYPFFLYTYVLLPVGRYSSFCS